jgi:hypothetical protein
MSLDAGLSQSPYWASTPERQAMRAEAIDASGVDACTIGRFAALYGVYVDGLESLVVACRTLVEAPGGEAKRGSLALILFAQGRVAEARVEGERAVLGVTSPELLVMSAIVLADGDLSQVRTDLFHAAQYGGADAAALLAYTYMRPDASAIDSLDLPALPQRDDEMPVIVSARLNRVAPAGASSAAEVTQRYRMGRVYFSHVALREPPTALLIPGEWSRLVSPAILLAFQVQNNR